MITIEDAKRILHGQDLSCRDELIVLLAVDGVLPLPIAELRTRCKAVGLPSLAKKNISDILAKANGFVARTPAGWELQQPGVSRIRELASEVHINLVVTHSTRSLRAHSESIPDALTKSFVSEAV